MHYNPEYVSLINHASIFLENQNKENILSDPWFEGEIFNKGWRLIYQNKEYDIKKILHKTKYIYLSHEHPDHFSVNFFRKYYKLLKKKNIKILFQETSDKRLQNFLEKKFGLDFKILKDSFYSKQKNLHSRLTLFKNSYIDSSLVYETKDYYHINFNDCNFEDEELILIKKKLNKSNKKRILYIQFSYAAYRSSKDWLKEAAKYKLNNILQIYKKLEIDLVIPFASFITFSNRENQNLNNFKNNCYKTSSFLLKHNVKHCFLNPLNLRVNIEKLISKNQYRSKINTLSVSFWDKKFTNNINKFSPADVKKIDEITINNFLDRIKTKNSIILMRIIRFLTIKYLFGDCIIYLSDTRETYKINFFSILKIQNKNKASLHMKSEVLYFMLKEVYGVDTLIVNGRFKEMKSNAFQKLILALGFTIINQSDYGINFRTLLNKFFIKKLSFALTKVLSKNS